MHKLNIFSLLELTETNCTGWSEGDKQAYSIEGTGCKAKRDT